MLSGTEAEIINSVARLKEATKGQIKREVGFSSGYVGFLCQYLVRKGYLTFSDRRYSLAKAGIKALFTEKTPEIDRGLLKEIAGEVAREISGEIKKTVKGIKVPKAAGRIKREAERKPEEQIKIKTDFEFPVEDESSTLESNINKVGAKLEKEKSSIDRSVELFKKIQKRGKK